MRPRRLTRQDKDLRRLIRKLSNPSEKISPALRARIEALKKRAEAQQAKDWGRADPAVIKVSAQMRRAVQKRKKLDADEQALRASIAKDVLPALAREQALVELRAKAKTNPPGFKREGGRWAYVRSERGSRFIGGDIKGPGARYVKGIVGPEIFEAALQKYGDSIIIRASKVVMDLRRERDAETARKVEKLRGKLARKLTAEDINRYLPRPPKSVKVPEYQLLPYGPRAKDRSKRRYTVGRKGFDKKGKRVWVPVTVMRGGKPVRPVYKNLDRAKRALNRTWHRKSYRAQVAQVLGLSLREVAPLVSLVEARARQDLARFKKTAAYAKLKKERPRMAAGMTLKKWMGAGIAALYGLADIPTYL